MIDKALSGNLLAGGAMTRPADNQLQGDALVEQMQMRMAQRDQKTPAFLAFFKDVMNTKGYPNKTMQDYESQFPNPLTERIVTQEDGMNLSGSNMPLSMFNATPPSVPISEQTPLEGVSQDIFGNPNILRDSDGNPLPNFTPIRSPGLPQPTDPAGLQEAIRTVDPIVSGDNSIASTQTVNPFQEQFTGFQNQLTGFGDQFTSLNDRLTKIEEGISSLLGNRGQGMNLGYNPMMNFGMGIGSLFQPLRGFYGQRF